MSLFSWTGFTDFGPIGTYLLDQAFMAILATIVGELTLALGYRINHRHLKKLTQDLAQYQKLSDNAEKMGDHAAFEAINREGNDVWGRLFFFKIALSAAALWPIFFALSWLQSRYTDLDLRVPGTAFGLNYVVVFLVFYVVSRLVFSRVSRKLPFFRTVLGMVEADAAHSDAAPRTQR
ncbi:hypothetical protein [Desulfosoma caldarium]|uniref:Uncharacterized protein n=1 Tax=Desulfosoma caldarium TaxID=610254 RepID=A0A3N1UHL7_9BACT|nr:hypothetical protein [Desulfosoma caldarium]ROQ90752.1 hypothetical protein EDC27_2642 [Desulfosoma caldarium]